MIWEVCQTGVFGKSPTFLSYYYFHPASEKNWPPADPAFLFGVLGIAGVMVCLYFQGNKHIRELEEQEMQDMN